MRVLPCNQQIPQSIARTDRNTSGGEKDLQNVRFHVVGKRTIPTSAVDKSPLADGKPYQYRPHKGPANDHIIDDAGDAGGT